MRVILFTLANRITTDPLDEKMLQRHGGFYATQAEWQKKATEARIDTMAKLQGPQLRTLIKKLCFLMSFEKSENEIAKTCAVVNISRKTFYLWLENDPLFKRLLQTEWNK